MRNETSEPAARGVNEWLGTTEARAIRSALPVGPHAVDEVVARELRAALPPLVLASEAAENKEELHRLGRAHQEILGMIPEAKWGETSRDAVRRVVTERDTLRARVAELEREAKEMRTEWKEARRLAGAALCETLTEAVARLASRPQPSVPNAGEAEIVEGGAKEPDANDIRGATFTPPPGTKRILAMGVECGDWIENFGRWQQVATTSRDYSKTPAQVRFTFYGDEGNRAIMPEQTPVLVRLAAPAPAREPEPVETLRDRFAMAAFTGLLAYSYVNPMRGNFHENCSVEGAAVSAYQYADAMLEARRRVEGEEAGK